MGELLDRFKQKYEWYRFCRPKKHKAIFDRIIEKSANHEEALKAVAMQTEAIIFNQRIDMEKRLRTLEELYTAY